MTRFLPQFTDLDKPLMGLGSSSTHNMWGGTAPRHARCHCSANKCPALKRISSALAGDKRRQKMRLRHRDLSLLGYGFRQRLAAAFDYTCQYCGTVGNKTECWHPLANKYPGAKAPWNIDRIDPMGRYTTDNVTLSCAYCNNSKHSRAVAFAVASLLDVEGGGL